MSVKLLFISVTMVTEQINILSDGNSVDMLSRIMILQKQIVLD